MKRQENDPAAIYYLHSRLPTQHAFYRTHCQLVVPHGLDVLMKINQTSTLTFQAHQPRIRWSRKKKKFFS